MMSQKPNQNLKKLVSNLPQSPGVYIYKNDAGAVLYIGKAKDIRKRVSSYFQLSKNLGPKTRALVANIQKIEHINVASEFEALLLEARLIKKFRPPYNVQWVDDKEYLYIKITTSEAIPQVFVSRREHKNGNIYFGPFPSSGTVRYTLKVLRKIFPYCTEKKTQMRKDGTNLYTDLGLCPGPHAGLISMKDYRLSIRKLIKFLEGKTSSVVSEIEKEMKVASKQQNFELAGKLKRQLDGIAYLTTQFTPPEAYLENPSLILDVRNEELRQLREILGLTSTPRRIECYDISTIQGRFAVGSMVVFTNAAADKRQYRKFRIRYTNIPKDVPNDFWMMREMLTRRLKRKDWPKPDLLLIDGGKGQLSAVQAVLDNLEIKDIPLASLAKRLEEIFIVGNSDSIRLPIGSPAMNLVQRLRDEAHRFAITYHKKLRNKETLIK